MKKRLKLCLFFITFCLSNAEITWDYSFVNLTTIGELEPIVSLLNGVVKKYLSDCIIILLYDEIFIRDIYLKMVISQMLGAFPYPLMHGPIDMSGLLRVNSKLLHPTEMKCSHYIAFSRQLEVVGDLLGERRDSKIVFVTTTSKWQVQDYLSSPPAKRVPNLLIISDPMLQKEEYFEVDRNTMSRDIHLFTHKFYVDALGSSAPLILTTWRNGGLTRPSVNLFPVKFHDGFNGHRLKIATIDQAPFVFARPASRTGNKNGELSSQWDGLEVRLITLLAQLLNFTAEFRSIPMSNEGDGAGGKVIVEVKSGKADMGIAGLYTTQDRIKDVLFGPPHTQDCASFVTLSSTPFSRYRAVFGPFTGGVWIAMTLVYLFGIIPLSFSDQHSFRHLTKLKNWESMFWYVFGTFTNCFTFKGSQSWTASRKLATRTFIAVYWVFTIIITAAYTGSIIAFITLPATPETIESSTELLDKHYKISLLRDGGWQHWFSDLEDPVGKKLLKSPILVPDIESGLMNVTRTNYLRRYAFLGSFSLIEFFLRSNTTKRHHMKAKFHLSRECFIPFMVSMVYNPRAMFVYEMNEALLKVAQAGFISKFERDIEWEHYRSPATLLMQKAAALLVPEERSLSLDDVQGVFILMGFGYILAQIAIVSEFINKLGERRGKKSKVVSDSDSGDFSSEGNTSDYKGPSIIVSSYEDYACADINREYRPNNSGSSDFDSMRVRVTRSTIDLKPNYWNIISVRRQSH